jgi:uncharacterized oligopeptide transporter (OPT) family protein
VTQTVSIQGAGSANIGCGVFDTFGSSFDFFFSSSSPRQTTASPGAGTLSTLIFVFPGLNTLTFDAVGTFVWSNVGEQTACATGGTSTVTLTGVIVFQDPSLSGIPPA